MYNLQNSEKILVPVPKTDIVRIICSLMNIEIDYKTVYGDLKLFESEIARRSLGTDMTILSYTANEHSLIKNMINKSIGKILLFVPGQNEHRVFISDVCVDVLFIVVDMALPETPAPSSCEDTHHLSHEEVMAQIRWHRLFNDATSFPDILRILDQHTFDFIITHYSEDGSEHDVSFSAENEKDIRLLGTVGTFLLINHKRSTLLVLHSNTPRGAHG